MTEKDILTILGVLTAAYPNARITPETVRVYVLTLQDIPLDLLENAALHLITTSTFFPTVAELRDASYRIMFGLHRVPTAAEAWNQIQRQRYQCLAYFIYNVQSEKPSFSHPFVEQVIHAFGCRNLTDPTSEPYMRANFCKTYDTLLDRTLTDLKTLPIVRAFSSANTPNLLSALKPEQPESRQVQPLPEWLQATSRNAVPIADFGPASSPNCQGLALEDKRSVFASDSDTACPKRQA